MTGAPEPIGSTYCALHGFERHPCAERLALPGRLFADLLRAKPGDVPLFGVPAPREPELTFFVVGMPITQGSKKAFNDAAGHARMKEQASEALLPWRQQVGMVALASRTEAGFEYVEQGAVRLELVFVLPRKKKHKQRLRDPDDAAVRPDADKLARAIKDALTSVLYRDDGQVTRLVVDKEIADPGMPTGVRVRILRHRKAA